MKEAANLHLRPQNDLAACERGCARRGAKSQDSLLSLVKLSLLGDLVGGYKDDRGLDQQTDGGGFLSGSDG